MNDLITQFDAGMHYTGDVQASTLRHPEEWFFEAMTWGRSDSGETVNPSTALTHGPVWQAVNILAGDMGQLPIHVYRKQGRKREREAAHPVDWLLTMEPNVYQTPAIWKETMMAWSLLWGNGCSLIIRDGAGRPIMLVPLMPDRTRPIDVDGEWWIETDFGDGNRIPLPYEDIFHVRGLATDGFWGLSAVQVCKNLIGGGLALRKHGNRTFKNSARPAGALTNPGKEPPPEVRAEYRRQLESLHSGADNAGKWLMLYGGTTFTQMSMSNVDAQWLEAAELDLVFVAGVFMLPPYKLGAMKNSSTRANTEQQGTDYINNYLSRHLIKFKEESERKLFNHAERRQRKLYVKWIVEAFLRGDLAARGAYYSQAKTGEWMTTNEIRELEDMNPIEGGDVLKNPAINPAEKKTETPPKAPEKLPPTDDDSDRSAARRSARNLIHERVDALLEKEAVTAQRVCNDAGSPDKGTNLVRWAENYYEKYQNMAEDYLSSSCELASYSGLGPLDWLQASCDHARDSLNRLLSMTGIVTKDSLAECGKNFAASVRGRKEHFANAILGE